MAIFPEVRSKKHVKDRKIFSVLGRSRAESYPGARCKLEKRIAWAGSCCNRFSGHKIRCSGVICNFAWLASHFMFWQRFLWRTFFMTWHGERLFLHIWFPWWFIIYIHYIYIYDIHIYNGRTDASLRYDGFR